MYGFSRSVLFGLAALSFVGGVSLLATAGPGTGGLFFTLLGGGFIIVLLFERTRYRSVAAGGQQDANTFKFYQMEVELTPSSAG